VPSNRTPAFLLIVLTSLVAACPGNNASSGPVDTCQSVGQQCRLEGGQLGVCNYQNDELACLSQH
jgi:hypothetical protein